MSGGRASCRVLRPDGTGPGSVGERADVDADRAVTVGSVDLHAEPLEEIEHVRVRMPVAVASADANHPDGRPGRRQEGRIGGRGSVVGHDEDLGLERTRREPQELRLGAALGVTGEQDACAVAARPEDDRRLVEFAAGAEERPTRRRGEDLEREVAERDGRPGDRDHDRDPASRRRLPHAHRLVAIGPDGRHPDRSDLHAFEDGRHATRMIEMGMRHHHEVEVAPSLPDEPVGGPTILAPVDEDPDPWGLQEERVPLTDVDGRDRQPGR